MDFSQLLNDQNLLNFFFRSFACVFSFIYLLFAIVIYKQTQMMNRTLTTKWGSYIIFLSLLQIVVALIIILLAFIFI